MRAFVRVLATSPSGCFFDGTDGTDDACGPSAPTVAALSVSATAPATPHRSPRCTKCCISHPPSMCASPSYCLTQSIVVCRSTATRFSFHPVHDGAFSEGSDGNVQGHLLPPPWGPVLERIARRFVSRRLKRLAPALGHTADEDWIHPAHTVLAIAVAKNGTQIGDSAVSTTRPDRRLSGVQHLPLSAAKPWFKSLIVCQPIDGHHGATVRGSTAVSGRRPKFPSLYYW